MERRRNGIPRDGQFRLVAVPGFTIQYRGHSWDRLGRMDRGWLLRCRISLLVFGWQGLGQCLHGAFKFGQVVVDGSPQDRVVRVEVACAR